MNNQIKCFLKIIFIILFALALYGCTESSSSNNKGDDNKDDGNDGRITVNIINGNLSAEGKTCYIGIFKPGTDHTVDPPEEKLIGTIVGGNASCTSAIKYKEENNYEIWLFIDIDNNADPDNPAPNGSDATNVSAYNVSINGNTTVTVDYNDLDIA